MRQVTYRQPRVAAVMCSKSLWIRLQANIPLNHCSLNHPSHTTPLNLNFDFIAKDGDGDTASGSFVVQVIDDAPKLRL